MLHHDMINVGRYCVDPNTTIYNPSLDVLCKLCQLQFIQVTIDDM